MEKSSQGENFEPGSIVWARLRGCPWWPSKIMNIELIPALEKIRPAGMCYPVYFYGSHNYSWIAAEDIKDYKTYYETYRGLSVSAQFKLAIREANNPESVTEVPFAFSPSDDEELEEESSNEGDKDSSESVGDSDVEKISADELEVSTKKKTKSRALIKAKKTLKRRTSVGISEQRKLSRTRRSSEEMKVRKLERPLSRLSSRPDQAEKMREGEAYSTLLRNMKEEGPDTALEGSKPIFADEDMLFRYRVKLQRICLGDEIKYDSLRLANEILTKLKRAIVKQEDLLKTKLGLAVNKIRKLPLNDEKTLFIAIKAQALVDQWKSLVTVESAAQSRSSPSSTNEDMSERSTKEKVSEDASPNPGPTLHGAEPMPMPMSMPGANEPEASVMIGKSSQSVEHLPASESTHGANLPMALNTTITQAVSV